MALIRCPECGKEFSDKAPACPNCGCPTVEVLSALKDALAERSKIDLNDTADVCPYSGGDSIDEDGYCNLCGMKIHTPKVPQSIKEDYDEYEKSKYTIGQTVEKDSSNNFNGIYKYTLFGGRQEVYCPQCRSSNCSRENKSTVFGKPESVETAHVCK